ncbi:glutamate--cysteine ligase [Streptomyces sp. NPDC003038]|uniref:carboxylate-amine ligase n=1 Tax=unclassified Streptomyces TaxID=2593676 RepID=UPI0033A8F83C
MSPPTDGTAPGPTTAAIPTIGVEEEYFLVDPVTRAVRPAGTQVVREAAPAVGDMLTGEFTEYQIEGRTPPCTETAELRAELVAMRAAAVEAARAQGLRLCAGGTPVIGAAEPAHGGHPRYRAGALQYRAMLDDFAVSAFHAHVYLPDRETAVLVGNHLRPWLPLLIAMTANSPFHRSCDTGYAGWRTVIRGRFPCLGPPPYAESLEGYERLAAAMADSEAMLEAGMPFWDVRPNPRLPTIEIRCMDVMPSVEDTAALTALIRALVVTLSERVRRGDPGPPVPGELVRAACWRAARDGWSGSGVDAMSGAIASGRRQAERLVEYVRPALERYGDAGEAESLVRRLTARGCGADRQRAWAAEGGLKGVVDALVRATEEGD